MRGERRGGRGVKAIGSRSEIRIWSERVFYYTLVCGWRRPTKGGHAEATGKRNCQGALVSRVGKDTSDPGRAFICFNFSSCHRTFLNILCVACRLPG